MKSCWWALLGSAAEMAALFAQVGAFPLAGTNSLDAAVTASTAASDNTTLRVSSATAAGGAVLLELYDAMRTSAITPTTPRLRNVSVLKNISSSLTAGFVIDGTGTKSVLIRGVGPSLAPFGITGALADPLIELFGSDGARLAGNDNWNGDTLVTSAFTRVGAFAFGARDSKDAALLITLEPGNYTVQVRGADGGSGVALIEIYEAM